MLLSIITSLHIFICVLLIILVLLQQGKGADAGVTFGGGGNTVFGAAGADNFITRFTTILACCFMMTSVYLGMESKPNSPTDGRLFKGIADSAPAVAPSAATSSAPEAANASSSSSVVSSVAGALLEQSAVEVSSASSAMSEATSSASSEVSAN